MAVEDVRDAARLTQEALAAELGLSKQTISNIERGVSGTNNLKRIRDIAEFCSGRGWLVENADEIRRFMLGDRDEMPLKASRRVADPLTVIEGDAEKREARRRARRDRSRDAASDADMCYSTHPASDLLKHAA